MVTVAARCVSRRWSRSVRVPRGSSSSAPTPTPPRSRLTPSTTSQRCRWASERPLAFQLPPLNTSLVEDHHPEPTSQSTSWTKTVASSPSALGRTVPAKTRGRGVTSVISWAASCIAQCYRMQPYRNFLPYSLLIIHKWLCFACNYSNGKVNDQASCSP